MANQQGNGRNTATPDEARGWRPHDENGMRGRRGDDDDRYMSGDRDDDRMQRGAREPGSRWERDEGYRSTERYGAGQSGYGSGRYEDDRSYESRSTGYPRGMDERARERGLDERFSQGRGGSRWGERDERDEHRGSHRQIGGGGYGHGEHRAGYPSQPSEPTSAQQFGDEEWGNEGFASGMDVGHEDRAQGPWRQQGPQGGGRDWRGGQALDVQRDHSWQGGRDWQEGPGERFRGQQGGPSWQGSQGDRDWQRESGERFRGQQGSQSWQGSQGDRDRQRESGERFRGQQGSQSWQGSQGDRDRQRESGERFRGQQGSQSWQGSQGDRDRQRESGERFRGQQGGQSWQGSQVGRDWQSGQGQGNWHGMHGSENSWSPATSGGYGGSSTQDMYGQGSYGQQASQFGGRGVQGHGGLYGQGGYNEGMYGQGGMQNRYGSQGYQGYGQQGDMGFGAQGASHRGKGPANYARSDERIRELVCEALSDAHEVDATHVDVTVKNGEVVLSGTIDDRNQKRMAEDIAERISGVKDVQNQIRVASDRRSAGKEGQRKDSAAVVSSEETSETSTAKDKRHRA
jgi:osmotically-inducible protein OsmY